MKVYRLFSKVIVIVLLLSLLADNGSLAQESRPQVGESPASGGSFLTGGDMHGAVGSGITYQDPLADSGAPVPLGTASAPSPADVSPDIEPGQTPEGLTPAEWDTIQGEIAAAEYHLAYHAADDETPTPYYQAPNRAQGWRVRFGETGVQVDAAGEDGWTWGLTLSGYGYGESIQDLTALAPALTAAADTLTYRWDENLSEWWVNGPARLEQGFTIQHRPQFPISSLHSPLVLEMAVNGSLTPVQSADAILFQDKDGETVLRYDRLHVVDADGKTIPSQLQIPGSPFTIQIVVDDSRASYPLTIDPWLRQEAKLTADDAATGDGFGSSVAVWGETAVIGAPSDGDGGDYSGSAYVFVRTGGAWSQQAKLTADDAAEDDYFGNSVAVWGDTAVIGAYQDGDDGTYSGSAYVFVRSGGTWSQQAKLTADDAAAGDRFGLSVAVSEDTAVIGAYGDDDAGDWSGSAYVFVRSGGSWSQGAKLVPSDAAEGDFFGHSVAVSEDTAVVGAEQDDDGGANSGSVYVFLRTGGVWSEEAKLTADDASEGDQFGSSVAVSGETAVIGAPGDDDSGESSGSAYVFMRSGGSWSQGANLTAGSAAAGDSFGNFVAVSGETAIIGARGDDEGGDQSGSAYVFVRSGGTWSQQSRLIADDAAEYDYFGRSVAVSGETVIVGAPGDDDGGSSSGSAYVFFRDVGVWNQQKAKLTADDAAPDDTFGFSVAVWGDTAVVGACQDDDGGVDSGSAYVFVRSGAAGGWIPRGKLTADDAAAGDRFGWSVAVWEEETVVIGAPYDDDGGTDSGSAYVFVRSGGTWSQQAKLIVEGAAGDRFGYSVAVYGETAAIGADGDDDGGNSSGSAYVFFREGVVWGQQAKLTASDAEAGDRFGYSVAVSEDTAVIGAPFDDNEEDEDSGSAYVYVRAGDVWSEEDKLVPADTAAGDRFGHSVAVSMETAVIGAPYDDDAGSFSGSAYVFYRDGGGWGEEAKLAASDAAAYDQFGWSVALFEETAVVGAYGDGDGGSSDSGSAYVFLRSGGTWSEEAKLTAGDAAADDWFGYSVAVSGETAVIGAHLDDDGGADSGSAYVCLRTGVVWSEEAKLTADDASAGDQFGWSVAVSGETAVVGAHWDYDGGIRSGSAYVFARSEAAGGWILQAKLTAYDAAEQDYFGHSVAVSGDTAVIGAYGDDDGGERSGSAYVFVRSGTTWVQQAKLTADDAAVSDYFGHSVAVSGDTAVIGAPYDDDGGNGSGSAYVFVRSGGSWSQEAKLVAGDPAESDQFGYSVAVSGDTAVIGAYWDDDGGVNSGSAYVFLRTGGAWSQQAKLVPADAADFDEFGRSVAVSGDTAVVGASWDDDGGEDSGSAYVFLRTGGAWSQGAKLVPDDAAEYDEFGCSVAVSGDTAVIGAYGDDDRALDSGSAYVFLRAGGAWSQQAKLTAADAAEGDYFGSSVAVSGETAVVGAYEDDDAGNWSGSAYVFALGVLWDGGGADNDWSNPLNWVNDTVPDDEDVASFGSSFSKDAVVDATFDGAVAGVHITDEYSGTISVGRSLAVSGDYSQDGGVVIVDPAHPFTVDGDFTHSGGTLQETRLVGSSSTIPFLEIRDSSMAVEYRGVTLDTTTSGNDLGSVVVSVQAVDRDTEFCTGTGPSSPPYAGRCFTITLANNLAANVTLWALTNEIPGTVTNPSIYRYSGGTWQELTNIATGTSSNYTWVSGDTTGFSSFLIAETGGWPTAVTLVGFKATPVEDSILVEWETATEIDTLGFNLYRSESPDGPSTRLNASLIPVQSPGAPIGSGYVWPDEAVEPGVTYWYWLEDVDAHGLATLHGPVSVQVPAGGQYRLYLPLVGR